MRKSTDGQRVDTYRRKDAKKKNKKPRQKIISAGDRMVWVK